MADAQSAKGKHSFNADDDLDLGTECFSCELTVSAKGIVVTNSSIK